MSTRSSEFGTFDALSDCEDSPISGTRYERLNTHVS